MKKPQNGSLSRYLADPVRTVMNLRPGGYATLALGAACVLLVFELVMRSFSEQAGSGIIAVCSALCLAALLAGGAVTARLYTERKANESISGTEAVVGTFQHSMSLWKRQCQLPGSVLCSAI